MAYCDCFVLNREDFEQVSMDYPECRELLLKELEKTLQNKKAANAKVMANFSNHPKLSQTTSFEDGNKKEILPSSIRHPESRKRLYWDFVLLAVVSMNFVAIPHVLRAPARQRASEPARQRASAPLLAGGAAHSSQPARSSTSSRSQLRVLLPQVPRRVPGRGRASILRARLHGGLRVHRRHAALLLRIWVPRGGQAPSAHNLTHLRRFNRMSTSFLLPETYAKTNLPPPPPTKARFCTNINCQGATFCERSGKVYTDLDDVSQNYRTSTRWINDCIASFPYEVFLLVPFFLGWDKDTLVVMMGLLRIPKLARTLYIGGYKRSANKVLEDSEIFPVLFLELFFLLAYVVMVCHIMACCFFLVTRLEKGSDNVECERKHARSYIGAH